MESENIFGLIDMIKNNSSKLSEVFSKKRRLERQAVKH